MSNKTYISTQNEMINRKKRCDIIIGALQRTNMTDVDGDDDQYRADREAALMTTTISTAATLLRRVMWQL